MKRYMHITYILLTVLLAATAATSLAFVPGSTSSENLSKTSGHTSSADRKDSGAPSSRIAPIRAQTQPQLSRGHPAKYVHRARLKPQLREPLRVLGDRLEKPGKERLVRQGAVRLRGESQDAPALVIYEHPGRLRFELTGAVTAGRRRVTVFDRDKVDKNEALDLATRDVIETLVHDSAEGFFTGQVRGAGTRLLGKRYRTDDGTAEDYAGLYYDIYQATSEVKFGGSEHDRLRLKLYHFNSDTLLLERVRYEVERDGAAIRVEVLFGDWREVEGQRVPHRIMRLENGAAVLTMTFTSTVVSPASGDGAFIGA